MTRVPDKHAEVVPRTPDAGCGIGEPLSHLVSDTFQDRGRHRNRAGDNLTAHQRNVLERAKNELLKQFGRAQDRRLFHYAFAARLPDHH